LEGTKSMSQKQRQTEDQAGRLKKAPLISILWFVLIILAGLYVRFFDLTDAPLDFHPTRQLHSLIIARGFYYENAPGISADQRQAAEQQSIAEGRVEPAILEWLVAQTYRIVGAESHVVARIYSIVFWMIGGFFIYVFSRKYLPWWAVLTALAFYLILPYAVYASRSFQPDPLMSMLCILAWFLVARWIEKPEWKNALLLGLAGGATILIKTTAVFYLAGVVLGIVAAHRKFKIIRNPQSWVILALFALPTAIYSVVVWGQAQSGGVLSLRFFPSYWAKIEFYLTWFNLIDRNIGIHWLALSLLGGLTLRSASLKGIYWGGIAGYILMGFALSHHISTHDYYLLPLIPIIGLGLAGFADFVRQGLQGSNSWVKWAASGILLGLVFANIYQARNTLNKTDYRNEPQFWQEIARELAPYGPAVGLTQDYGLRLTYWGGISIANWFTADEIQLRQASGQQVDFDQLFEEKTENANAFLVTLVDEYAKQEDLKHILDGNYPQVSSTPGVWLYDLRKTK